MLECELAIFHSLLQIDNKQLSIHRLWLQLPLCLFLKYSGFHQHCLALGAASIDRDPPQLRNISGLTLGISQSAYEKIVERMSAFRKEIAQIADEDEEADKVYQLQLLLFPIGGKL